VSLPRCWCRARARSRARSRRGARLRRRLTGSLGSALLPRRRLPTLRRRLSLRPLRRCARDSEQSEVARFKDESGGDGRCGARAVAPTLDDDCDGELRSVDRRDAEEPTVNALLRRENGNFVLAYRIAAAVALDFFLGQHLAGLGVVFGNLL